MQKVCSICNKNVQKNVQSICRICTSLCIGILRIYMHSPLCWWCSKIPCKCMSYVLDTCTQRCMRGLGGGGRWGLWSPASNKAHWHGKSGIRQGDICCSAVMCSTWWQTLWIEECHVLGENAGAATQDVPSYRGILKRLWPADWCHNTWLSAGGRVKNACGSQSALKPAPNHKVHTARTGECKGGVMTCSIQGRIG